MCTQPNIIWYIATLVLAILATGGIMYLLSWWHEKKHPPNDLEWLDTHMNKDHFYPNPFGNGQVIGKLTKIVPAKGNRSKNKPNYTFTFSQGNHHSDVNVNAKWELKK